MALKVGIELKDRVRCGHGFVLDFGMLEQLQPLIICDNSIETDEGAMITMPIITKSKSLPNEPQIT